ncbi:hypothetical protein GBO34_00905 [Roseivirga pacifica]|uniref:hypothetical protein n=1 Tax=Roseivirga pacifica TaxID=1267423 RepID=UPI002095BC64|nr:hypothetical protein [Roseivirga pacifica]MCO6367872.1 hypothetical protein [Roseivirga pacifica]MCO6377244.1 hypothetical protein [Roseivirga pacifica]
MNQLPILMNTDMVVATLDGRKTVTRRTQGLEVINDEPSVWDFGGFETDPVLDNEDGGTTKLKGYYAYFISEELELTKHIKVNCGKPGDLLYVRETYAKYSHEVDGDYHYKADGERIGILLVQDYQEKELLSAYRPSIHMPKSVARIWLQVKKLRLERLLNISPDQAIKEGISSIGKNYLDLTLYRDYSKPSSKIAFGHMYPRASFKTLWESINGQDSWIKNPWVWVMDFEVLSTKGIGEINLEELTNSPMTNDQSPNSPINQSPKK